MLFYKDEEDYKKGIEENIKWNEERIRSIKEWDQRSRGWLKRDKKMLKEITDAGMIKVIRQSIKTIQKSFKSSEDTIKAHMGFIANSQKRYIELTGNRYGKQKLKVIQGGQPEIV